MDNLLEDGEILAARSGKRYEVIRKLGGGGQGEVYEVEGCGSETRFALKWYFRKFSTDKQESIVENLIQLGSPDPAFLWPGDIIYSDNASFGYVMPLRPRNFAGIADLMKRRAEPSFAILCRAAFNLARGYEKLHEMGLAYGDISFGNLFFEPESGAVLICDNDNATSVNTDISVNGTPRFMAPEIVTGRSKPSRNTDLFSLAVLLFNMFMLHHPLEGAIESAIKCMDVPAMNKLYGTEPVFIFDPDNHENRPVEGFHDNAIVYWSLYPEQFRSLFTRAFTVGLFEPAKRVTEREWKTVLANLLFGIMPCSCGAEVFANEGASAVCWNCRKTLMSPMSLVSGRSRVLLHENSEIVSHFIKGDYDICTPTATVVQNPDNPDLWGVRNESDDLWTYIKADGMRIPVPPGRTAGIAKGAKIEFGFLTGEFV